MSTEYEAVIGLEVHCQLLARTKLFCGARCAFGDPPNTHISPVSLGLPGSLPVPNREAVTMAVRVGLSLGCEIRRVSRFARKHYFYPDLPKGYQITQYDEPICERGELVVLMPDQGTSAPTPLPVGRGEQESEILHLSPLSRQGEGLGVRSVVVRIERAHIEEDAGKNIHGGETPGASLVDFNRAGVPLVEIVSAPDLRSGAEAAEYLRQLRSVLMFIGANDGNLEEGSFRCDANVSVRPKNTHELGTRTEIKNVNSFRFVQKAIEWEIAEQIGTLSAGGRVEQCTKTWDEPSGRCNRLRTKEGSDDYRYFPEPDLGPLVLSEEFIEGVRAALPELPAAKRARYLSELGLAPAEARVLTDHPGISEYFEALCARTKDPVRAARWVCNVLKGEVTLDGLRAKFPASLDQMCALFELIDNGTISGKIARDLYAELRGTSCDPRAIVEARGLSVMADPEAVTKAVQKVLGEHPRQVGLYQSGKKNIKGFFKGEVMKITGGRAHPGVLDEVLTRLLGG